VKFIIKQGNGVLSRVKAYIDGLYEEKSYIVTVKEYKKSRSLEQNAYYWVVVGIISDYTGYDKDGLHEAFKRNFIGKDEGKDMFGNYYCKPKSTTELNTKQFGEYLDKVMLYALNNEIQIEPPSHFGYTFK